MNLDYILYGLLAISLVVLFIHKITAIKKIKMERSVIEALKQISESMKAGNSFETAIKSHADQKEYPSAKFFQRVLDKAAQGKSTEDAMTETANESNNEMLSYITEVIVLTLSSKGNIIASLSNLSNKLWEINHIQKKVDDKASSALTTLQFVGIAIIPAVFYFISGVLSSKEMPMMVDLPMQIYFFGIMIIFSFMDYFIFRDLKESLFVLPAGVSIYLIYIITLGPMIGGFFAI